MFRLSLLTALLIFSSSSAHSKINPNFGVKYVPVPHLTKIVKCDVMVSASGINQDKWYEWSKGDHIPNYASIIFTHYFDCDGNFLRMEVGK